MYATSQQNLVSHKDVEKHFKHLTLDFVDHPGFQAFLLMLQVAQRDKWDPQDVSELMQGFTGFSI